MRCGVCTTLPDFPEVQLTRLQVGTHADQTNFSGHPFDTVKIRLQTAEVGRFKGPMDVLRQATQSPLISTHARNRPSIPSMISSPILPLVRVRASACPSPTPPCARPPIPARLQTVAKEGVLGLYKGVTPPLLMTGFINAALFGLQARQSQHEHARRARACASMRELAPALAGRLFRLEHRR